MDEVLAAVGGKGGTLASISDGSGAGGGGGEKRKRGEGGTLNDDDHDDEGLASEEKKEDSKEMEMDAEGQKELLMYDRKVLRASKEMASATEKELESLGVPFFGKDVEKTMMMQQVEMNALREKMVAFLEELCEE